MNRDHSTPQHSTREGGFGHAIGWTVVGAIIPGLGLWRARRRVAGGLVLAVFLLVVGGGAGLSLANREAVENLVLAQQGMLQGIAIGLVVLAALWVVVIGVSHLALRPADPSAGQRAAGALVVGVLSLVVAGPLTLGANIAWITGDTLDTVVGGDEDEDTTQPAIDAADPWANKPRLTIAILGGDSGTGRDASAGMRADTVIVASINTHTGATTLFTLPRNAEHMPFPKTSPLARYYPNGFTSPHANPTSYERSQYLLNAMYRVVPTRVPHDILGRTKDFGASVMKVSVGHALGLPIDYYVKVDMDGFKDFIDAIGGITVNINYKVPIGGDTDAHIPPSGYLKPGPAQHLDAHDALWYARGRYGLDDYKRMERQRCVINAVMQQTTPGTVLANFQSIAKAGEDTITTDVPRRLLPAMADLAVKVKDTRLRSVVFDLHNGFASYDPDWNAVRKKVQKALAETSAAVQTGPASPVSPNPRGNAPASKGKSDDLDSICGYHPD